MRTEYNKSSTFWKKALSAIKFQKGGLWGVKTPSGDILLDAEYDQIEFCADFIYAHYGNRHKFIYEKSVCDCKDEEDDYRFYKNGKIGLRKSDGSVFLPAEYDEIIDWGSDADVVYVRIGKEFHYYNHNREEILAERENIPEDAYPNCPYSLAEDQDRHVLICAEPIAEKETGRDCFVFGQWCRLSRIPQSQVRDIFADCDIVPVSQSILNRFYGKDTYMYSARECKAETLRECIRKLESLECYDSSWSYMIKVTTNSNTLIDSYDLYEAITYFEDLEDCEDFSIAIGRDDELEDGVVHFFQIHFFSDDMGAFLYDSFKQSVLLDGSVEEVKHHVEVMDDAERTMQLSEAFGWIEYSEKRTWKSTEEVLNYLLSVGAKNLSMLLVRQLDIFSFQLTDISPANWMFKRQMIQWAINNGAQLNAVHHGETVLDRLLDVWNECMQSGNMKDEKLVSIKQLEVFINWLKTKGAMRAIEQRKNILSKLKGLNPCQVIELVSHI